MLQTLKKSTEPKPLIELAVKHLRGILGDLTRRKKVQEAKALARAQVQHPPHTQASGHPMQLPTEYQQPSQPQHQQRGQDRAQVDGLGLTPAQAYALQTYQEARSNRQGTNGVNTYESQAPGQINGMGSRDTPWEV